MDIKDINHSLLNLSWIVGDRTLIHSLDTSLFHYAFVRHRQNYRFSSKVVEQIAEIDVLKVVIWKEKCWIISTPVVGKIHLNID